MKYMIQFILDNNQRVDYIHECECSHSIYDYVSEIQHDAMNDGYILVDNNSKPFLINTNKLHAIVTCPMEEVCAQNMPSPVEDIQQLPSSTT